MLRQALQQHTLPNSLWRAAHLWRTAPGDNPATPERGQRAVAAFAGVTQLFVAPSADLPPGVSAASVSSLESERLGMLSHSGRREKQPLAFASPRQWEAWAPPGSASPAPAQLSVGPGRFDRCMANFGKRSLSKGARLSRKLKR